VAALSQALDDLTAAVLLLALIEVRTVLARRGFGQRRSVDQEDS
jgi:hypothetical protein